MRLRSLGRKAEKRLKWLGGSAQSREETLRLLALQRRMDGRGNRRRLPALLPPTPRQRRQRSLRRRGQRPRPAQTAQASLPDLKLKLFNSNRRLQAVSPYEATGVGGGFAGHARFPELFAEFVGLFAETAEGLSREAQTQRARRQTERQAKEKLAQIFPRQQVEGFPANSHKTPLLGAGVAEDGAFCLFNCQFQKLRDSGGVRDVHSCPRLQSARLS